MQSGVRLRGEDLSAVLEPEPDVIPLRNEHGMLELSLDLAQSIEQQPVVTLTITAGAIGAGWGALAGLAASKIFKKRLTLAGAVVGGILFGAGGYEQGKELQAWLSQH